MADAFANYPLYEYTLPNNKIRKTQLHILFETEINYALNYGMIYATSEKFEGIMYCLSHYTINLSSWKLIQCGALRIPFKLGTRFIKFQQVIQKIQAQLQFKYMKPHSVYLWAIGINPQFQNKGYGKTLIQYLLNSLTQQNKSCYLETVYNENLEIYYHLGFKLKEQCPIPNTNLIIHGLLWSPHEHLGI